MSQSPPRLFDRDVILRHRARAAQIAGDTFLQREAVEAVGERLSAVNRRFDRGVMIDSGWGVPAALSSYAGNWTHVGLGHDEALGLEPHSFDLAISILALHAVNDLPGVLAQIRRALKPDGLFMAALFGGATLFELRESLAAGELETTGGVSPRIYPFADVRDLGGLLQRAGFALPVADVERTTVRYREFSSLVHDLRALGETNALTERSLRPLSRETLAATLAHYAKHHAEPDGRLRATFEIVYLTGWAPHESQQQPLRPGSAKARLADALGTTEKSLPREDQIQRKSESGNDHF
jgi:SAM-dependent methyltransferase